MFKNTLLKSYSPISFFHPVNYGCLFLLFFLSSQFSFSQTFPNPASLSTGQGPLGTLDPIWIVSPWYTSSPPNPMGLTYSPALISNNCAPGSWVTPGALPPPINNGNWITGNDPNCAANTNAGYRYFRLVLDLPADCNGNSIAVSGNYILYLSGYVDNYIENVFLNGNPLNISGGNFSAGGQLDITIPGPWSVGINYVDILVLNTPNGGNANPYGLLMVANSSVSGVVDTDNDGIPDLTDLCPCAEGFSPSGCPPPITSDTTICSGQPVVLEVSGGDSFLWSNGATTSSITVSPDTQTVYSVTVSTTAGSSITMNTSVSVLPRDTVVISTSVCSGDSFFFNNSYISQAGIYYAVEPGLNGCDSLTILELSTIPVIYSYDTIASCAPYSWNGQVFSQSGDFTFQTLSTNGCDSVANLRLTINSPVSSTFTVAACDSFVWINGVTYYQSTQSPTFTTIGSNGCDSLISLDLTINQSYSSIFNTSACDSFTWINGVTYTQSVFGPFIILPSTTGCDSLVTLDLTILPSIGSFDSVFSCSAYVWPVNGQTYLQSGVYTETLTGSNGCDSLVTLYLYISADPLVIDTLEVTSERCVGSVDGSISVAVTGGTPPYNYSWSSSLPGVSDPSGLSPGIYFLTISDAIGCSFSTFIEIDSGINPELSLDFNSPDCTGGNGSLIAVLGNTCTGCTYSLNGGLFSAGSVFTGLTSGTYEVIVENASGCRDSVTAVLSSPVQLSGYLTATDLSCSNSSDGSISFELTSGNFPYIYTWSNGGLGPTQQGLSAGNYSLTVTDSLGCVLTLDTILTEPPAIWVDLGPDVLLCLDSFTLTVEANPDYIYNWSTGALGTSDVVSTSGVYSVTVTDAAGCSAMDTVSITLFDSVRITIDEEYIVYPGQSLTLAPVLIGGSGNGSWVWTPSDYLSCTDCRVTVSVPESDITYRVTYTDAYGCSATETISIELDRQAIYIPDAFSPNGDGENDLFGVYGIGIRQIEWRVFNRWGEKVYETRNITEGWDGTYSGKLQPVGVYVYYALITLNSGKTEHYQGSVTLIR